MPGGSSSALSPFNIQRLAEPALPLPSAACLVHHLAGCSTGIWPDELASEASRARPALLAEGFWLLLLSRDAPSAPVRACMPSLLILGRAAESQLPAGGPEVGMVVLACCLLQLLGPLLAELLSPTLLKASGLCGGREALGVTSRPLRRHSSAVVREGDRAGCDVKPGG